jgi:MOSC domain-containing protein YiiM
MSIATVTSLCIKPSSKEHRPPGRFLRESVSEVQMAAGLGIVGDAKVRSDSRQLNILPAEVVAELSGEGFRCGPGELGEQIVVSGLDLSDWATGTCLQLGSDAVIELVYLRVPCGRFALIQSRPKDDARGRIGFMAKVRTSGRVCVGSSVLVIRPAGV